MYWFRHIVETKSACRGWSNGLLKIRSKTKRRRQYFWYLGWSRVYLQQRWWGSCLICRRRNPLSSL